MIEFKVRGVYLSDIKQQVRSRLKIGKKIKILDEGVFVKVMVVGIYPNSVTVERKNDVKESFTYWEIYNLVHA